MTKLGNPSVCSEAAAATSTDIRSEVRVAGFASGDANGPEDSEPRDEDHGTACAPWRAVARQVASSGPSSAPGSRSGETEPPASGSPSSGVQSHHAFRIAGELDIPELVVSLRAVLGRDPGLAASLEETSSDVAALGDAAVSNVSSLIDMDGRLRATVCRLSSNVHLLELVADENVLDTWSLDWLIDDLGAAYEARISGQPFDASSPRSNSEKGAAATSPALGPGEVVSALDAARRALASSAEPLELPSERPRPLLTSGRGALRKLELDAELIVALRELAQRQNVGLSTLLLAAFLVALGRTAGRPSLRMGLRHPNRASSGGRALGGLANSVLLVEPIDASLRFVDWLERVEDGSRQALRGNLPSHTLREGLAVNALFDALFEHRDARTLPLERGGLLWSRVLVEPARMGPELRLVFEEYRDQSLGFFAYCPDRFDDLAVQRLARSYETLLRGLTEKPETELGHLPLLHPDERDALDALNATARQLPDVSGFHELIRIQAARTPDRVAVISEEESVSYAELERRAAELAGHLMSLGVARHARVGVAVGRSARLLQATLGVLKAGATYVPLDPDFPEDRLAYMIEDAKIEWVVTEASVRARLPAAGFQAILLDRSSEFGAEAQSPPSAAAGALDDIAYVIYTSGSTGRPKGVRVPHSSTVNFLCSMADVPGFGPEDAIVSVTTLSFDIAVLELFLPLTVGGRVVVASPECQRDGQLLGALMAKHGVTMMQATPTTWQLLLDSGWTFPRGFRALCGGEAFPRRMARELIARCDAVWNMYGPTETTVWSTCQELTDPDAPILVGKPIANTQTYVLDASFQRVPFGVTGELCIGGLGVTAGYLDRPELTEQRFIPDTFGAVPGARLYRTGDLARQWPSGTQLFGRADNQVKVRGYRIELGEIESALESDHQIGRCAVVVRRVAEDDDRLVAYFAGVEGAPVDVVRLRAAVRERLPGYMVPQYFLELERLPLTPNGKIDRNALPDFHVTDSVDDRPRVGARDSTEEMLVRLWSNALQIDSVGVTDNFFDIGGQSLLAVQLVQAINQACNTTLQAGFIFEFPTIREQAECINAGHEDRGVRVVPLQPLGTGVPLFCICGINLYQSLARNLGTERPAFGIFLPVEGMLLEGSGSQIGVREMAREYVRAIRSKDPEGPYCLAGVSFGAILAYEVAQQLREANQEVKFVAILDVVLDSAIRLSVSRWLRTHGERVLEKGARYPFEILKARLNRRLLRLAPGASRKGELFSVLRRNFARLLDQGGQAPVAVDTPPMDDFERLVRLRNLHYAQAWEAYKHTMRPYDSKVIVVRAEQQESVGTGYTIDRDFGWSAYVRPGSLHCHDVPGDHLGILDEPNVRYLAELLQPYFPSDRG